MNFVTFDVFDPTDPERFKKEVSFDPRSITAIYTKRTYGFPERFRTGPYIKPAPGELAQFNHAAITVDGREVCLFHFFDEALMILASAVRRAVFDSINKEVGLIFEGDTYDIELKVLRRYASDKIDKNHSDTECRPAEEEAPDADSGKWL
jgi:hypothetical protein